ncbi:MAG: N-acetylmuramoyl-L-alanine amidase [bacterium]
MRFDGQYRLAALILALLLGAGISISEATEIVTAGGTSKLSSFQHHEITYVSLSEIAEVLGGRLDWELMGHKISYVGDACRFDFVLGSPFFKVNDKVYNQTFPAQLRDGQLFVPAQTFIPFLNGVQRQTIMYDKMLDVLRIDSEYFNVLDLAVNGKANGLLIEVLLTGALGYDVFLTEGNWLNISITDARINTSQILARKDRRYMYKLTAHQSAGNGQISMRLRKNVGTWQHKLVYDPPRIQISIADADFNLNPEDTAPKIVGPDDKIDVIVIDPGHGGSDYGAIGQGGTREKDVVLAISRELAKLMRTDKQFRIVTTRDRDTYISLEKRAEIANNAGADLFISIHANASPKKRVSGWNVFFLAPAKNDSARAVAQFENSFFLREEGTSEETDDDANTADDLELDPILTILNDMIMTEFQEESHDFAMMVAKELNRKLKIPARGVDQAGFFVLNQVFTPSVLIETGFISNKNEEKLLKSDSFQKQVAESLYKAIKRFKEKYENN